MTPLVGLSLGGRAVTEDAPSSVDSGVLGRPVWGPGGLLRDLELRLGLPASDTDAPVRVQCFARALHAADADSNAFFAKSLEADPLGTARTLLGWRDELLLAGWDGERVAGGGVRLDALAAVEALVQEAAIPMPLGTAERVKRVERALVADGTKLYPELRLAEPIEVWPGRWRGIFDHLAALGTRVVQAPALAALGPAGRAIPGTDLARVQAALSSGAPGAIPLTGDGTFVVLRAETSWELADCTAALLARRSVGSVVVRGGDTRALDLGLSTHGLSTQGSAEASPWRGALQVLSLAVQLLFAPRDVFRVLDLVSLPGGPFDNLAGRELSRALAEMPGVGGRPWLEAKQHIAELVKKGAVTRALGAGASPAEAEAEGDAAAAARVSAIVEWLEAPVFDRVEGAPKAALLGVVSRAQDFLRARMAVAQAGREETEHVLVLQAAIAQAEAMHVAVTHDARARLDREAALQLVRDVAGGGATVAATREEASRVDVADGPAGVRRPYDQVLWWHAAAGTEWRPGPLPWRAAELAALAEAKVVLADRAARLAAEAESWLAPVMAASQRLVLCVPGGTRAGVVEAHPVLTQIAAAVRADEAALARVSVTPNQLLGLAAGSPAAAALLASGVSPPVSDAGALPLPPARPAWRADPALLSVNHALSASQIDTLVGCPLKWVLEKKARLRAGALATIASGPLLLGKLAHRTVEELHQRGALGSRDHAERELPEILPTLMAEEAAPLLRIGKGFETTNTDRELKRSIAALAELLESSALRVIGVETEIKTQWLGRDLNGRIDVLLTDRDGREVVLDLKWGARTYRGLLAQGTAVQLAVYAGARQLETGSKDFPHAAYFALARGELLATEPGPYAEVRMESGATIAETWTRLERTLKLAEALLARGEVLVTGVQCTGDPKNPRLPLLDAGDVAAGERGLHLPLPEEHGCTYCSFGALCGRKWEGMQ